MVLRVLIRVLLLASLVGLSASCGAKGEEPVRRDLAGLRELMTIPGTPDEVWWQVTDFSQQGSTRDLAPPSSDVLVEALVSYRSTEDVGVAVATLSGESVVLDKWWYPAAVREIASDGRIRVSGRGEIGAQDFLLLAGLDPPHIVLQQSGAG